MNYVESCINNIEVSAEELDRQAAGLTLHMVAAHPDLAAEIKSLYEDWYDLHANNLAEFLERHTAIMKGEPQCSTGEPSVSVAENGQSDELRGGLDV